MKYLLVLPDGTRLYSGAPGAAVLSAKLTQSVNRCEELTLGSACSAMLEAKLLLPDGISLQADQELTLYKVDAYGQSHQVGVFVTQKPERLGRELVRLTAFDRMVYTDRDLSAWVAGLTGWPYTLSQLAEMVCRVCGLEMISGTLPNGDLPVQAFKGADITGREAKNIFNIVIG